MKRLEELGISPAPWDFQPNNPDGPTVTDKWNWHVCGSWDMNKANARLIAAAPELYECLHKFVNDVVCSCAKKDCDNCKNTLCWVKKAKAVLAKASGEVA